jgi:hypothetical protein
MKVDTTENKDLKPHLMPAPPTWWGFFFGRVCFVIKQCLFCYGIFMFWDAPEGILDLSLTLGNHHRFLFQQQD